MNNSLRLLVGLIALLIALGANAQDDTLWKSHLHSLEISTGIPYPMMIHPDTDPMPSSPEGAVVWEMWENGQSKTETMYPNLTLTYSFRFAKDGEISFFLNMHGYTYAIRQHPEGFTSGMDWNYDINTVTKVLKRGYVNMAVVPGFIFKYYWYNRDVWKWYSGAGIGFFAYGEDCIFDRKVTPEVILAGTHFGRKHVYGVAEFVLGPTGLGPQIGLGYRF